MNAPNSRTEFSASDRSVSSMRSLAPSSTRRIFENSNAVRSVSFKLNQPLPHASKLDTTAARFLSNQSVRRCKASSSAATRCVSQNSSTENGAASFDVSDTFTSSSAMQNDRFVWSRSRFTSASAAKHRTASGLVSVATNANRSRDDEKSYPAFFNSRRGVLPEGLLSVSVSSLRSTTKVPSLSWDFVKETPTSIDSTSSSADETSESASFPSRVEKSAAFIARAKSRLVSVASASASRLASAFCSTRFRSATDAEVAFSRTLRASFSESNATPS
mmetsp:Transcript_9307/g.39144  ORF Transcript_9307/g.39144 Transcript_9307/m.39144 type:complete len:275 (-) Transcript_9307:42-866(-)